MAIWDDAVIKAEEEEQAKLLKKQGVGRTSSKKCPGCGADLRFDAKIGKLACASCGSIYNPETMSCDGSLSVGDIKAATEEDADKVEFCCQNCGATIVTKVETSATFCAHCGSSTLIRRKLEYEFAPDLIAGFSITKEDAVKRFKKWIKEQKMKPHDFCSNFKVEENIMGVYVPFWLIDSEVYGHYSANGIKFDLSGYFTTQISRDLTIGLRRVPFNGGKKIDNFLMRALEPFDYSKLQYYNDNYLTGFYAERYTETPWDMYDAIKRRLNNYGSEACKNLIGPEFDEIRNELMQGDSGGFKCSYVLLPIWFINYNYKGTNYQFGVNGQTGEVGGEVPIRESYRRMQIVKQLGSDIVFYIIFLFWFFAGLTFAYYLSQMSNDIRLPSFVLVIGTLPLAAQISITKYKLKWISFNITASLDPEPPVEEYIDNRVASKINKEDQIVCYTDCTPKELSKLRANNLVKKATKNSSITTLQVLAEVFSRFLS